MHPASLPPIRRGVPLTLMFTLFLPFTATAQREATTANAAAMSGDAAQTEVARRGPTDPGEIETFLDGVMRAQMKGKNVAGATVAVVRDGGLLFAKGYGYSDVDERNPVDPERTLFRIGSVTKLFTWTAVMQLVESGDLDLDADVNTYLDFEIPATFDDPITMWHIMTHTPGFEEDSRDLFTEDPDEIMPLGEWLATHVPGRVRPPGVFSSYSNYATALAGYVVERVSGTPYDEYIEQHILEPLGMEHTTTRQPLPEHLAPDMSQGYVWAGGRFVAKPFEIILGAAPAGSVSASATDMARFMLAHLDEGQLEGRRILSTETARTMHARAFGHDDRLNGFALGFYEKSRPGLRAIGHGGDTQWFHTDLALIPSEDLGVFVSYNTVSGGELSFGPFFDVFMDHYYPVSSQPVTPTEADRETAARIAGEYAFNRRSYTTFQKAVGLAGAVSLQAAEDGALVLESPLGRSRLVPVGPLLYRDELGEDLVAFRESADGHITYGFLGIAPMMALERVPWSESTMLHRVVLGLALLVFLGTVVAAPRRWWRKHKGTTLPGDELPGRKILVAMAVVNLAFAGAVAVLVSDPTSVMSGPLTGLKIALALPVIGVALALGAAFLAVRQWIKKSSTLGARLRYGTVVVLALIFAWSLNVWNLLGWRM